MGGPCRPGCEYVEGTVYAYYFIYVYMHTHSSAVCYMCVYYMYNIQKCNVEIFDFFLRIQLQITSTVVLCCVVL